MEIAFNGKKSGPVKLILLLKENEQITLIIKAYAENAVMLIFSCLEIVIINF